MPNQIVLRAPARIDANTAPSFDAQVKQLLAQSAKDVLFDLEDTVYISAAGLRVFLAAQKKMNSLGGVMALTHLRPQIMEIFEVTGLAGVLTLL